MKNIYLLFATLAIFVGNALGQTPTQILPDFKFFAPGLRVYTDKNLPSSKMLFFVFFESDCEHCQHAIENLSQQFKYFAQTNIYLVSLDSHDKMNYFLNKYGHQLKNQKNVLLMQDSLNQFIVKFKPRRYPAMFLYSADKKLLDYEDNEETLFRFVRFLEQKGKIPG